MTKRFKKKNKKITFLVIEPARKKLPLNLTELIRELDNYKLTGMFLLSCRSLKKMKRRMRDQHQNPRRGPRTTGGAKKGAEKMTMGIEDVVMTLDTRPENQGASLL